MDERRTIRNVAIGFIMVLLLMCVSLCVFLFPRSAAAEQTADGIYTNVSAIYNIGDSSIVGKYGAYSVVEGKADKYGYYTESYENSIPTYTYSNHASGWVAAVNAQSSATDVVLINIVSDWFAELDETMYYPSYGNPYMIGTSTFGENEFGSEFLQGDFMQGFAENTILVPSSAYIRLNLNGKVISRNLSGYSQANGAAIAVDRGGHLELVDSAPEARHLDEDDNPVYTVAPVTDVIYDNGQALVRDTEFELTGGLITGASVPPYSESIYYGGVCVYGGTFVMNGGSIALNRATLGAGVHINSGTFIMNDGKIVGNAENSGPYISIGGMGVYLNAGKFDMNGGEIAHNITANGTGAGVLVSGGAEFRMSGGAIRNNVQYNTTQYVGGGVAVSNGKLIMSKNALIEKNFTTGRGGGVSISRDGALIMNGNSAITNNAIPYYNTNFSNDVGGGGVYCNGGTLEMNDNSSISYNHSEKDGGGIYADGGLIKINSGSVSHNDAKGFGGGIYANGPDIQIHKKADVSYNSSQQSGGGIFYRGSTGNPSYCLSLLGGKISHNTATNGGGGVYVYSEGTVNLYDGEVSHNTVTESRYSSHGGGGVLLYSSSNKSVLNMYDGSISYNTCNGTYYTTTSGTYEYSGGGGVSAYNSTFNLYDGEIANNVFKFERAETTPTSRNVGGGGVYVINSGRLYVSGGTITNNATNVDGDGVFVARSGNSYLSGSAKIYGNGVAEQDPDDPAKDVSTGKDSENHSNLYLSDFCIVNGKFNDDAEIHVTYTGSDEFFATRYGENNNDKDSQTDYNYIIDPNKYFISDDPQYKIISYDHEQSYYNNVLMFTDVDDVLSVKAFYGEDPDSASPIEIVGSGAYGITLPYKVGYTAKCVVEINGVEQEVVAKLNGVEQDTKEIDSIGKLDLEFVYADKTLNYAVVITSELTAGDVTVELKGYADYAKGVYTYEYTGSAINPEVKVSLGNAELEKDMDYTVAYGDNTEVGSGSGSVIIEFTEESGYSGTVTVSFDIDITGGSFTVTWQIYDHDKNEWNDFADENAVLTYIPGENGNQNNAVRAKLNTSKLYNDAPVTKYAYAEGVTDYKDGDITSADISGYAVVISGKQGAIIWNVGEYSIELGGSDSLGLGTVKDLSVEVVQFEITDDDERLFKKIMGESEFKYDATEKSVTVYVAFDELVLRGGVDYNLEYENNIDGGTATAKIVFCGNYTGVAKIDFTIVPAQNTWNKSPGVIRWNYGEFDADKNMLIAEPKYLAIGERVHFSIVSMSSGRADIGLEDIAVEMLIDDAYGVCYKITDSAAVAKIKGLEAGAYKLIASINGTGSYDAISEAEALFEISKAQNDWTVIPAVRAWRYGAYDATDNAPVASAVFGAAAISIIDKDGNVVYDSANGVDLLNEQNSGEYTLVATVAASNNYDALRYEYRFNIAQAQNDWVDGELPTIASWVEGEFGKDNLPVAASVFGSAKIVIKDKDGKVVYDNVKGVNSLKDLSAGTYFMTASVAASDNYYALEYSRQFKVLDAIGLPWWAVLLIVLAALALAAIIILILNRLGVFQILSEKMVVSIRAKADADATIAAVRAGRYAEAAYIPANTEAADDEKEKKEKKKAIKKAAALEKKALTPEEKAAELAKKAAAMKERAAALRAKAKTAELRAAEMAMTPEERKAAKEAAAAAEAAKRDQTPEEKAADLEAKAKAMRKKADAMKVRAKNLVMTPEERKAMKEAEKAAAREKGRVKSPEEKAELLEKKAEMTEEQAAQLKAKAEVMKNRATVMRERAARKAERENKQKQKDEQSEQSEAQQKKIEEE